LKAKNLLYSLLLCLVFMIASACSPAAGPDHNQNRTSALEMGYEPQMFRFDYASPPGPYDDERGFKNDFFRGDLNPNLVTGRNDLYNLDRDMDIIASLATTVPGVHRATASLNGGTAHLNVHVKGADRQHIAQIKDRVHQVVQAKMPRYKLHIEIR
jgi:hypothetical protein